MKPVACLRICCRRSCGAPLRRPLLLQTAVPALAWLLVILLALPAASVAAGPGVSGGQVLPGKDAWEVGRKLAETTAAQFREKGAYPQRVCTLVWGRDAAGQEGPLVSFVLALLGTRPRWNSQGSVTGVELVLLQDLGRPRLDAMVVTTGQFRDQFGDEVLLMDQAFRAVLAVSYDSITASYPELRPALEAAVAPLSAAGTLVKGSDLLQQNYPASNWVQAARGYLAAGKSAGEAGELAVTRIFAPAPGSYGSGVEFGSPAPESGKLAGLFVTRVGYSYSMTGWGRGDPDLFRGMLAGSGALFYCRSNSRDGIGDQDGAPMEYTYLTALSASLETYGGSTPQLFLGGWSGGGGQAVLPDGGLPLQGGAGPGAAAAPGVSLPKSAPAVPQPPKADLQYLAEKEETPAGPAAAGAGTNRQGSQPWRIFEVSAGGAPLQPGQDRLDIEMAMVILLLFFYGAGRRYKEYAREVTR